MTRPNQRNDQSTSQEEQSQTDAHSASLQTQLQQFVPYTEGPKMDWTVNDGLYHQFLKWKLKCENILDCELATLSETRQCKKLIAWSGDDGMDLVVSWGLTDNEITLATLWTKFEDFCKPQSNEVRARFDLLTSFRQGDKSVDEWFNAVQKQIHLCKYPPETASILQRDIFWFYLKDEEFVSKTLNEGCADLEQYPASKVRQLAKKLESSKATARHIKQATSTAHAAQINLLSDINGLNLHPRRRKDTSVSNTSNPRMANHHKRSYLIHQKLIAAQIAVLSAVIPSMQEALPAQQKSIFARLVRNMDTLQVYAFQSRNLAPNIVHIR